MNILITGGAGFIGSNLINSLLQKGHKVIVFDTLSHGEKNLLSQNVYNPLLKFLKIDLLNNRQLHHNLPSNIDLVFHLAANSDIAKSAVNPEIDFKNTTLATFNLLCEMKTKGIKKIFYTSGSGIYGDTGKKFTPENYGPLLPTSMYGATKLSAESMISAFSKLFDIQAWIIRPANIIGPNLTHGVVYDLIKKLNQDPTCLEILGDGKQSKSYLYISDVIDAIYLILKKAKKFINIFNVSTDTYISVDQIAKIIIREMGLKNVKIHYSGGRIGWKGDIPIVRIKNTKLKKIGWKPKYSSSQAVINTVRDLLGKEI